MLSINQAIELGKMIYKLEDKLNVIIKPILVEQSNTLFLRVSTPTTKFLIDYFNPENVDFSLQGTYERAFAIIVFNFFKRS